MSFNEDVGTPTFVVFYKLVSKLRFNIYDLKSHLVNFNEKEMMRYVVKYCFLYENSSSIKTQKAVPFPCIILYTTVCLYFILKYITNLLLY